MGKRRKKIGRAKKHHPSQSQQPPLLTVNGEEDWAASDNFFRSLMVVNEDLTEPRCIKEDSDGFSADEFYVILDKPYRYYECDNLDEIVSSEWYRVFSDLKEKCKHLDLNTFDIVKQSCDIKFITIYDHAVPKVKMCVTITKDFNAVVSVHDRILPYTHELWSNVSRTCTDIQSVKKLLDELIKYSVCTGNSDPDLQELIPVGAYLDVSGESKYQGYREQGYMGSTIRSTSCCLLSKGGRCKHCAGYRRTLRKTLDRKNEKEIIHSSQRDFLTSKVPNGRLTENEKLLKIKQLKRYSCLLETEVEKLSRKVDHQIRQTGVILDEFESSDFMDIMNEHHESVQKSYPIESSYQRLFWEQQRKHATLKNKKSMRWHPMIIKWCIYLKSKSVVTYDALKNSGFIRLPSERTLHDYSSVIQKGTDFQPDIIEMLISEGYGSGSEEVPAHKKIVGILQDEIRIKSDLVYDRHSGQLIGFIDLGSIGNDLVNMDEYFKKETKKLAKYVLVIMVRGISSNLKFPLAHFATSGVTSDQLFSVLWQAVEILEIDIGLTVLFITSDGASPNRRFIRLHATEDNDTTIYRSPNVFAQDGRYIYFISDPPHLIKTARNCFGNSHAHKKTRQLWKDGHTISWMHIVDLYKDHCSGIYRLCPKLIKAHIDMTPFSCMKVSLAAQVLSSTVANALEMLYGNTTVETVKFIRHMNKFFDCLNVGNLWSAQKTRNDNVKPFVDVDDERLEYLLNDFLNYFSEWRTSIENRHGQLTKSQKSGMQLSYQTLEGLEITVKSVVHCIRYCLEHGMPFVLTEKFNQDPIEQHFGVHRSSQGCNTNPNLNRFNNAMVQIRMVGGQALAPIRGNTKRHVELNPIDNTPLPKKKRQTL